MTPAPSHTSQPHLAANPDSPFFARIAAGYLEEGRTREALALCVKGTQVFPRYVTGALMLGRCYEMLGRHAEALVEYRKVLRGLPDNAMAKGLVESAEVKVREAFEEFAATVDKALLPRKDTMSFEVFIGGGQPVQASTVEYLIKQLQQAPKMPRANITPVFPVTQEEPPAAPEPGQVIMTETLAEIYANQGQYREAIQAYTVLLTEKPDDARRFTERIAQLQEMLKLQGEGNTEQ